MPPRPGPLDNLPRPLDERDRRRGRTARRIRSVVVAAVAVAAIGFATGSAGGIGSIGGWALPDPIGAVAGVLGTAGPDVDRDPNASAAPTPVGQPGEDPGTEPGAATPDPTLTPRPSPTSTPDPTPAPPSTLTGYQWPLPKGRLTLPFGPSPWGSRLVDGETFHDGVDLATFCGDRVVAAHAGTVLTAGRHYDAFMGWIGDLQPYLDRLDAKGLYSTLPIVVVIDDGNGYRSMYAHFSKVVVKKGEVVAAGDLLGYEGMTGRASGCHVHYGLFSPLETATFGIDPGVAERMLLPAAQVARIDPLLVLPERPKPTPKPTPTPISTPGAAGD